MMNALVLLGASQRSICSPSTCRCAGVIFTRLKSGSARTASVRASTPCSSGRSITLRPEINGAKRLVTVRSKEMEEWTGDPRPSARGYARRTQSR